MSKKSSTFATENTYRVHVCTFESVISQNLITWKLRHFLSNLLISSKSLCAHVMRELLRRF